MRKRLTTPGNWQETPLSLPRPTLRPGFDADEGDKLFIFEIDAYLQEEFSKIG